jgi:restriction endonuclease Mrr
MSEVKTMTKSEMEDTAIFEIINENSKRAYERRKAEAIAAEQAQIEAEKEIENRIKKAKHDLVMNILKYIFMAISIAFFTWIFVSWINVISHNTQPGGYELIWDWNFFKMFFTA